ncbi:FAD binding domain-containing protein [Aspergillus granulosus]|uniref:FAD binding domain-containing protein n=1 Tax=Aspergillus granulosus TaxID=176169 RepID=A0ABR4H7G1_9EURO
MPRLEEPRSFVIGNCVITAVSDEVDVAAGEELGEWVAGAIDTGAQAAQLMESPKSMIRRGMSTLILGHRAISPDTVGADGNRVRDFEDRRERVVRVVGTDFGMHGCVNTSSTSNASLLASRYRESRIFVAGDAAHRHSPAGGMGMNVGIQDAMNLGWKLAAVINGWASPDLLNTYESERRPVGRDLLRQTRAQTALAILFSYSGGEGNGRRLFESSFYPYCIVVAGGIHALAVHWPESETLSSNTSEYVIRSLSMLEQLAANWQHAASMVLRLNEFIFEAHLYAALLEPACLADGIGQSERDKLWMMIDYGMVCTNSGPQLVLPEPDPLLPSFWAPIPDQYETLNSFLHLDAHSST